MPKRKRDEDRLVESALTVLDRAFSVAGPLRTTEGRVWTKMIPLFSGGYDSLCACYVASKHPQFEGTVYHINTGIGSEANRTYVRRVCAEMGWRLKVYRSPATYEKFVKTIGFPGPGGHQWVYNWLKDRCIGYMTRLGDRRRKCVLVTGCRSEESTRRMGHVEPIKIGETSKKTGKVTKANRVWAAPCHDWTREEQISFVDAMGFPRNPVKDSLLSMSGECFCGAFATPGELDMIRQVCPDVAVEIDRLTKIAEEAGTPCRWGTRPDGKRGEIEVGPTGPLCSSCDRRAAVAGFRVRDDSSQTNADRLESLDRPPSVRL